MLLLASFNSTGPPLGTQLVGAFIGAILYIAIGILGRLAFGVLAGGVGAGAIAWFVIGAGTGDLTGLLMVCYSPIIGLAGAALGGIVAGLGTAWRAWASGSRFADIPLGICAGVLGAGAIAWFVIGAGSSRVKESLWLIYAPIFGAAGAVLGAIAVWLEKAWRMRAAKSSKRHAPRSSCDDLGA
jgi:hypothetical protein